MTFDVYTLAPYVLCGLPFLLAVRFIVKYCGSSKFPGRL